MSMAYVFPVLTVIALTAVPETPKHQWQHSYRKSLAESRRADKPLFIVFCPGASAYGEMTRKGPFLANEIEQALKADYARLFVDTSTKQGKALANAFEADNFPHLVVIDRTGTMQVYWQTGPQTVDQLSGVLKKYRRAKIGSDESVEVASTTEDDSQESNDRSDDDFACPS